MNEFIYSILAAIVVSALSLSGILVLGTDRPKIQKLLFWAVSFSAGSLLGGAFFHLLPEALEQEATVSVFVSLLLGFASFFILEKFLRWHHCHELDCIDHKIIGYQNLAGDAVHNFLDGLIIVSSFSVSIPLGIAVTVSVIFHEVPQEIGDFGVLLYSGFSRSKALWLNLFSALLALLGVIVGQILIGRVENLVQAILPFAAGGFIYIAASDLIPELHKERALSRSASSFGVFVAAILFMLILKNIE